MQLFAFSKVGRFRSVAIKKLFQKMKAVLICLFVFTLQASAKNLSQEITLSLNNVSLETVFKEIQKQTHYRFVYTKEQLDNSKKVSVEVRQAQLVTVLELCFKEQPLSYTIEETFIVISFKEKLPEKQIEVSQLINVAGKVINENGEGVVVTVAVKGTDIAVSTDADGYFLLKDIKQDATLVITGVSIKKL